jgi:hypothetical protein
MSSQDMQKIEAFLLKLKSLRKRIEEYSNKKELIKKFSNLKL